MFKITILFVATCYLFATANAQALPFSGAISSAANSQIHLIAGNKPPKTQPKKQPPTTPTCKWVHGGVNSIKIKTGPGCPG
jgi:hypothetical protein